MPTGAKAAFERIKDELATCSKLAYQQPDATLSLLTDASQAAVGAVIQQKVGETIKPLAYFSATLTPTQKRYSAFGRELLAVYMAVKIARLQFTPTTSHLYTQL